MSRCISSATYIPNNSPYRLFFHSKKLSSSCTTLYVLWHKVSFCRDNTYKYSPSKYAHILSLSFFVAAFLSWINRFILDSLLCNFSISVVYQGIPFHRWCCHYNPIRLLVLDRWDYLCSLTMVLCYRRYRLRWQIV